MLPWFPPLLTMRGHAVAGPITPFQKRLRRDASSGRKGRSRCLARHGARSTMTRSGACASPAREGAVRRLSLAIAVLSLVLAACGQPAPGGGTAAAPSATVAATASPTRGGTAIVAIWQFPSTLAAHYANQTVSDIESIDLPNDLTAVVHYKSIYAPYPLNFFSLMPKHLLEKEADISKTDYVRRPLGTGPFKITEFKTDESITLEKNTNYRGAPDKPYLDKIIFKSVPSSQVGLAQLQAGEVHAMWNLTEAQTPDVEKTAGLALQVVPGPTVERIELNTAENKEYTDPNSVHPVIGDIEMRKALLYATPKQSIIDKLLFGKAKPGSSPVSQGWAAYKEPQ